jgi:hypothetical protein
MNHHFTYPHVAEITSARSRLETRRPPVRAARTGQRELVRESLLRLPQQTGR